MKFCVLIKGDQETSELAISQRGFTKIRFVSVHNDSGVKRSTLFIDVPYEDYLKLTSWFAEEPEKKDKYGYPDGTLLHYREIEEAEKIADI
jgi:hypothetical protein